MHREPYTSTVTVILDFKREVKSLRNIIDRFSLPSEKILRPAIMTAFSNLSRRYTGNMIPAFFFQSMDLVDELLIPLVDSHSNTHRLYQMDETAVEKERQEIHILVNVLGRLIEDQFSKYAITVPENPNDILSTTLRGDSLYVTYNHGLTSTPHEKGNYYTGSF